MESSYAIASGGKTLITMADEEITTCAASAVGAAGHPCGGGSDTYAAAFGLTNGMEPKSDYSAAFDNTAYYQSSPNPGSCRSDLAKVVKYTFPGYCKYTTHDPATMVAYLAKYGPALITVDASHWSSMGGSMITDPATCSPLAANADHAVNLVGWGTDSSSGSEYWIIRNQWSTNWGMSGFTHILKDSKNVCGVTNTPFWVAPCSSTIGLSSHPITTPPVAKLKSAPSKPTLNSKPVVKACENGCEETEEVHASSDSPLFPLGAIIGISVGGGILILAIIAWVGYNYRSSDDEESEDDHAYVNANHDIPVSVQVN